MAIEAITPVPTPDGWVKAADLKPGNVVFKPRGGVQAIGSVQAYIPRECYRVTFDDGTYLVGDRHASLMLQDRRWRSKQQQWFGNQTSKYAKKKFRRPLNVKTFALLHKEPLNDSRMRKKWSLQTVAPLEYPQVNLPVPPYVLGLWLGSVSPAGRHWLGDKDFNKMQRMIRQFGFMLTKKKKGNWLFSIRPSVRESFTFAGAPIPDMIPQSYLEADVESRRLLFQGLVDAQDVKKVKRPKDGWRITDSWSSIRRKQQLVESLGYKTNLQKLHGKINFSLFFSQFPQNPALMRRFVQKVEKIAPTQCVHIAVDGEFVAGEGFLAVC